MTAPILRALAALLGLPHDALLPLPVAIALAAGEPQTALAWGWDACRDPRGLHDAMEALLPYAATLDLRIAWQNAVTDIRAAGETLAERNARACAEIRAAVPCPVLPAVPS